MLVTGSRAALVSMIPGLAYLFYLLTRRHKAVSIGTLVGLAAMGVLAIPFVPARVLLRLEGTDAALRSGNLNERETIWSEAIRLIREHPIQGSGGGAFRAAAVGANKAPHDLALGLLAEVGVIGFGLFAAMLVTALLVPAARRAAAPRHVDRGVHRLARGRPPAQLGGPQADLDAHRPGRRLRRPRLRPGPRAGPGRGRPVRRPGP